MADSLQPPELQFGSCFLRQLRTSDGAALFPTLSDPENHRFTVYEPHRDEEQTRAWIQKMLCHTAWAIAGPENTAIGFICYRADNTVGGRRMLGYHLSKACWGQGIMPAALRLTDAYLFSHTDISVIAATTKPENIPSQKCLLKAGYRLEQILDNYVSQVSADQSRIRYLYTKARSE